MNLVGADVVEVAVSRAVPFRLVIYMCALMLASIGPFFCVQHRGVFLYS